MPPRTRVQPKPQTPIEQHAEWLNLLRPDGPFVSAKFLAETFPQGLDVVPTRCGPGCGRLGLSSARRRNRCAAHGSS
jgi:hypothetical protein